jgi:hypothetical protein
MTIRQCVLGCRFVALVFVLAVYRAGATPLIVPLDAVPGANGVSARAMDASGRIVGGDSIDGGATVWLPMPGGSYAAQRLPLLPGAADGFANAVNAAGTIAGYHVDAADNPTAVVWQPSTGGTYTPQALPTPFGAAGASAYSVNASGQVAGFAVRADQVTFAVVWSPGATGYTASALPAPVNTHDDVATAINDGGDVTGYVNLTNVGGPLSVAWTPLAGGGYTGHSVFTVGGAVVTSINNNRVGAGTDIGGSRAMPLVMVEFEGDFYASTLPVPIGSSGGGSDTANNADVLVGYADDPEGAAPGHLAAIWLPNDTFWDYANLDSWLKQMDPTAADHWLLREANFITDSNLVIGDGSYDPDGAGGPQPAYDRSFVLDVSALVPEPGVAGLALPAIALLRRRRRRCLPRV